MPRIMLVDDDYTVKIALEASLISMGYDVVGLADSGEQAVEMARDLKPDVILMDIVMPGHMDGITAAEKIRSELDVAILFLTGYGDPEYVERAKQVEPFGYVMKPWTDEEIRASVEIALYKKEAEATIRGSEKKYRSLFENSPIGIAVLDKERNILDFNDAMLEINGYTREDMGTIGNTSEYYYNPEEKEKVTSELSKNGLVKEMEVKFKRKDGTPYDALLSMRPMEIEGQSLWHAMIQDISNRKWAEDDLRKSRREWEGVFQAIGHPTLILDTHHRLIHANAATEKATGKPETDLIGKRCYEIFHNTNGPPEGCPCERMIASGHLETVEMEMEALGGSFLVSCTPMVDDKGRIERVIHIATDITERKQDEQALRQSEHKFHLLFDNAPIGYQSLDENGCFLDVNQACLDILGYERHEVIGKWFGDFLPFELADIFREKFKQNIQSHGLIQNVEFPLMRKDGSIVLADYMARIGRDEEGRFLRTHCAFSDITEKRKAEEALKESEERFRTVANFTYNWEYWVAPDGRCVYVSPSCERITGYSSEDFLNDQGLLEKIVHPDDQTTFGSHICQAVQHKETLSLDFRIITRSGKECWISHACQPVYGSEGDYLGQRASNRDISKRKLMEEALRQSQKMEAISTLSGGIAHDYNNLLAVIMGNLSMAREEAVPHSAMAEFLHEIEQASYKARDLTHQFLTLSQGGHPRKELGSMESLLKEILGQVQAHEVSTTSSIQDDLWPVEYDSKQMHFAISNVIINAVEAMPQGGTITLQAENQVIENKGKDSALPLNEGKYVRLSIKDEGIGIPEEDLDRIFDPYFSTKERGVQKGMGLGLATAYAVVQKHGGHIMVNSTIGVGTTITIYLPASERPESKAPGTQRNDVGAQSTIPRILVMDDEEGLRTLAQKMLERLGYKVETVKGGVEAIETYKKHMDSGEPFDGVILDLTIKGGMGGVQAIKELIKIDPDVKAIVCSGYFNDPVLANFEEHGFRGAMAKPYQKADLESVLKKVLG